MNKFVRYILFYLAGMLLLLPFWIIGTFGNGVTVEQIIFHLRSGIEAVEAIDRTLKVSFVQHVLAMPLLFPLIAAIISIAAARFARGRSAIVEKLLGISCFLLLLSGSAYFVYKLHIPQYIASRFGRDIFSGLYADPSKQRFTPPAKKKNLVLIYVESLETDLSAIRPRNINAIREIEELPGYKVKEFLQAPGTGWSIAGILSSQSGVPLKPFYYNIKAEGNFMGNFAQKGLCPNLVCVSDILSRNGYTQYFLTGPDLKFADMDKFFSSHHYNYAIGRDEWLKRGVDKSLFTTWGEGIQDDTLFDEAYRIIMTERAMKRPFVVSLITVDTHCPDGFPSPRCNSDEANSSFTGAFRYTSRQLAAMVRKLMDEGVLEDTEIIIMGDHLFMANDEQIRDNLSSDRRIYFKMITADKPNPNRDTMTHFDIAPTILDLLGMRKNPEEHFGLGISLFSKITPEKYSSHLKQVMSDEILSPSIVYDRFWNTHREAGM
ncbi:MAG: sulfatase-like hydrolase/transferase [Chlorobiaceae bacterium]|nr:sulfatase-like hydrolase/transferase [Chlorobiaceae bacterium]